MIAHLHPRANPQKSIDLTLPEGARPEVITLRWVPVEGPPEMTLWVFTHETRAKDGDPTAQPRCHYRQAEGVMIERKQNLVVPGGDGLHLPPVPGGSR